MVPMRPNNKTRQQSRHSAGREHSETDYQENCLYKTMTFGLPKVAVGWGRFSKICAMGYVISMFALLSKHSVLLC